MTACFPSSRLFVSWLAPLLAVGILAGCQSGKTSRVPDWVQEKEATPAPASSAGRPAGYPAPEAVPPGTAADAAPGQLTPRQAAPGQTGPGQTAPGQTTEVWLPPRAGEPGAAPPPYSVEPYGTQSPYGGVYGPRDNSVTLVPPRGWSGQSAVPRVAMLLPLSGRHAAAGQALLNAAQLALFDFADERFELMIFDTQGTPEGAARAVAEAIGDGAGLILGPLLSSSVDAVAPTAQSAGINVVAFSNDRTVAGAGVFVMGFLPGAEVDRVIRHAWERGIRDFAALAPNDAYGATVVAAMNGAVQSLEGAELSRIRFYDPFAEDFTAVVRDLADFDERQRALEEQKDELRGRDDEISKKALERLDRLQTAGDPPFEALIVPDGGKRLLSIAALLPFYDVDPKHVRMLGTGQWDIPGIGAEPALLGGWFAAPNPAARSDFESKYRDAYGNRAPRIATLAYDATALASVLAQSGETGGFSYQNLTNPNGFAGRDGIFRFLADGTVERGLAVLQVRRRSNRVISRAPNSFGVVGY